MADGGVAIDNYVTVSGFPGTLAIPAGNWTFNGWFYVSSGTTCTIKYEVCKLAISGVSTVLFTTASSSVITSTSAITPSEIVTNYTIPSDITILTTDRIIVRVLASNSSVTARTVHFLYQGTTFASHIETTLTVIGVNGTNGTSGTSGTTGTTGTSGTSGTTGTSGTSGLSVFPLLNDEWLPTYDFAGNPANLVKYSLDNTIIFGAPVEIDSFYNVLNAGFNDIVDIPVDSTSPDNTQHGVGITVGGTRLMSISALATGTTPVIDTPIVSLMANVGIGTTSPTAVLHLKAGTATASTAPLKFTSGPKLTVPESGVVEFDGIDFWVTI